MSRASSRSFASALALVGDKGDAAAATAAMSKSIVPRKLKYDRTKLPDASLESGLVVRRRWSPATGRLRRRG